MRVIFMGTPEFSTKALEAIVAAGHEVVLVVTQPDKPKGRGKEIQMSPVKICATNLSIPVFQPVKIKTEESVSYLKNYPADVYVVAAFGQLLSQEILDIPKFGCINIHASLLPRYRGAAPIQWSIINHEAQTGVTIMQMDAGLDTGDMILSEQTDILQTDTGDILQERLSHIGADLICRVLHQLSLGEIQKTPQDDAESCYAPRLLKKMGFIDWSLDATKLECLIRGMNSRPGTYTMFNDKQLKIWEGSVVHTQADNVPGSISQINKDSIIVNTGCEQLAILTVQPEGKKKMPVSEFIKGYRISTDTVFKGASCE